MNPKEQTLNEILDYIRVENDKPCNEIIITTTPEYNKQLEDALRSAGAFGKIESEKEMKDWDNVQHTEQGF